MTTRHRVAVGIGAAAIAAVVAVLAVTMPGDGTGPDPADSRASAEADGPPTSAARGAEGTRTLSEVPDELPAGLVVDDAEGLEAVVARGGDDWSATVSYRSGLDRDALADAADTALGPKGFRSRGRSFDDEVMVVVYDGEDGSVITVTLRSAGDRTSFHAIRVSP